LSSSTARKARASVQCLGVGPRCRRSCWPRNLGAATAVPRRRGHSRDQRGRARAFTVSMDRRVGVGEVAAGAGEEAVSRLSAPSAVRPVCRARISCTPTVRAPRLNVISACSGGTFAATARIDRFASRCLCVDVAPS
ncbi:unnamed protein product, partial [Ectocarpus sp. 12 AP-2014]